MKKRLLCIVVAMLMVLPMVLVSCGSQDEKDKMKDIILGTDSDKPIDRAYTLSLWIPTDAITVKGMTADLSELTQQQKQTLLTQNPDVYEFLKRVDDVEDAINEILIGRSYYTKIDIVPVNNEYYEETIANKLETISSTTKPGEMNDKGLDTPYENEIAEELVGNKVIYDLLYRPVDKNQLDIFLIRDYGEYSGYEQYADYANKGYLLALNDPQNGNYVTTTGKYASITKLIRDQFLQEMKIGDKIYALPNNHLYADQYQYILINKELLAQYDDFNVNNMNSFASCIDFINAIGESAKEGVVPFVGNYNDIANFIYADFELGLSGNVSVDEQSKEVFDIESIFDSEAFNNFVIQYKELQEKGYAKTEANDGETVAVRILNGTSIEASEYANDYYVIQTAVPVADTEDVFASMFAISTFSLNYDRSMKILNLLQSDTQIRTLLQYGIEGEDYSTYVETVDGEEIEKIKIKDTLYKMNSLYTGNQYYTYPGNNTVIDDWDYVKETNLDVIVNPFIKFDYLIENGKLSNADRKFLDENRTEFVELWKTIYSKIEAMTLSEYKLFLETYNSDFDALDKELAGIKDEINQLLKIDESIGAKNNEIAAKREAMQNDGSLARYEALLIELETAQNRKAEIDEEMANGIYDNFGEWMTLDTTILEIEGNIESVAGELIKLEEELDKLLEDKETSETKKVELQAEYDELAETIENMKANNEEAYIIANDADYAKLISIYKKLVELL